MAIQGSTRYIAFGCSYTQYGYPTYADFIGQHFDYRENLGSSGAGNRFIFHKLISSLDALRREGITLTENDLITIQWSGLPREDKIKNGEHEYPCCGYLGSQGEFSEEYINKYFSIEQSFYESINYIVAAKTILDSMDVQYKMFNMMDLTFGESEDFLGEVFYNKLFNDNNFHTLKEQGYLGELNKVMPGNIESIEGYRLSNTINKEKPYYYSFPNDKGIIEMHEETHPTPESHYEYAKYLSSKLNFDIMRHNPRNYQDLFNFCDHYFSKEHVKELTDKNKPVNETHLIWEKFGIGKDNTDELSRYRSNSILEYLNNYKQVI